MVEIGLTLKLVPQSDDLVCHIESFGTLFFVLLVVEEGKAKGTAVLPVTVFGESTVFSGDGLVG